ncbi:uncharacterized protein LOC135254377 [Anguilla rostrata]|uniref:Uncharacterized protein n=1 Tax=Anguilla anguilla TaxID=7936 RepID=A0A9D3MFP1_ANGAN|nr:hypothetical protein ANANG_G00094370 [Anguilla anguilla]
MTRIVFIKLLIVVLAAFIICLPEFFTSDQEEAHQQFFCCSNCTAQQENRTAQQENRTAQQENRTAQQENRTHAATRLNHHCCILHSPGTNPAGCKTSPLGTHTPGAHWWSGRLTWLALILAVILLVLGSLVYEVQRGTNGRRKKAAVLPISTNQPPQSPGRHMSGRTPAELMDEVYFNGYRCRYKRSTLSPICEYEAGPELPVQENHVNSDSASASRPANEPSLTGRN